MSAWRPAILSKDLSGFPQFIQANQAILNFVVCILLRVLDPVQGFPSNWPVMLISDVYIYIPPEDGRTTETFSG
jgi:hypothetical protein